MSELTFAPIQVALTRPEYAQAVMRMGRVAQRRGTWPRHVRWLSYIRIWTLPVLVVVGLKAFHPTVTSGGVAGLFLVLLLASICFYAWLGQSGYLYRWMPGDDGSGLRPHTITVEEAGLFIKSELTSTRVDWAAIKHIDDHAGLILVFLDRASAMTIPRRCFSDASVADRAVAAMRARIVQPMSSTADTEGASPVAKWTSRVVLGLIALLIVVHVIEWITGNRP